MIPVFSKVFLKFLSKSIPFYLLEPPYFFQNILSIFEEKEKTLKLNCDVPKKNRQIILKPNFFYICLKFRIKNYTKFIENRWKRREEEDKKIVANSARPKFGSMYSFISMKMSVHLFQAWTLPTLFRNLPKIGSSPEQNQYFKRVQVDDTLRMV